ncbi:hypothetical protein HAX54_044190, partial [Datura stramonium]|nr:hypothetical protein [Datura stramonium]
PRRMPHRVGGRGLRVCLRAAREGSRARCHRAGKTDASHLAMRPYPAASQPLLVAPREGYLVRLVVPVLLRLAAVARAWRCTSSIGPRAVEGAAMASSRKLMSGVISISLWILLGLEDDRGVKAPLDGASPEACQQTRGCLIEMGGQGVSLISCVVEATVCPMLASTLSYFWEHQRPVFLSTAMTLVAELAVSSVIGTPTFWHSWLMIT